MISALGQDYPPVVCFPFRALAPEPASAALINRARFSIARGLTYLQIDFDNLEYEADIVRVTYWASLLGPKAGEEVVVKGVTSYTLGCAVWQTVGTPERIFLAGELSNLMEVMIEGEVYQIAQWLSNIVVARLCEYYARFPDELICA